MMINITILCYYMLFLEVIIYLKVTSSEGKISTLRDTIVPEKISKMF